MLKQAIARSCPPNALPGAPSSACAVPKLHRQQKSKLIVAKIVTSSYVINEPLEVSSKGFEYRIRVK
jgi:hypothetical protein